MPQVSVIIPVYNVADLLPRALDSVRAQTFADWECLIVDDASTDGTEAVAREAVAGDGRFRYERSATNRGPGWSRNRAIELAEGEWLAFLDADDWWEPTKLAVQLEAVSQRPDAAWSHHGGRVVSEGRVLEGSRCTEPMPTLTSRIVASPRLLTSAILVHRDTMQRLGGFDATLIRYQTWDMWLRLILHCPREAAVLLPEVLCSYRMHDRNVSEQHELASTYDWRVVRKTLGRGWWLRHPLLSLKIVDGYLTRELERRLALRQRGRACRAAMAGALIQPIRAWRWRRFWRYFRHSSPSAADH